MLKPTIIVRKLIETLPDFLHLPANYQYTKLTNQLDQELLYLKKLVLKKGRAIDVGANQGIYTYAFSQICSVVEVFEPQPWCTEGIVKYAQKFKKNINVYNYGLSNSKSLLTLNIPVIHGRFNTTFATGLASFAEQNCECKSIEVPICKLDDYNFKDVVVIKIDVEGHEQAVIEGARETIIRNKPVILVEIEQRHLGNIPIKLVFKTILDYGYKGLFLYKGELINLEKFSYEKYQKPFLHNLMAYAASGDYINNFIFMPL